MTKRSPKKQTPEESQHEREELVTSIKNISRSVTKLTKNGLNRRAIVALIQNDTKLSKTKIECVLDSLETLEENFTQ